MNLNPFTVKDSHKHIGSNIKLRLDRQGKVDDGRSNVDEKEGLVRATQHEVSDQNKIRLKS